MKASRLAITCFMVSLLCNSATAADYDFRGEAYFSNLQGFLANGEDVPYIAVGFRSLGDRHSFELHTGSIMATSPPEVIFADENTTVLQFTGVQGPNPFYGGENLHVTMGRGGMHFTSWDALFTMVIDNATGTAVFSGDGNFTVEGGTGQFTGAAGGFRTLFESESTPLTSDTAVADVNASGEIDRKRSSRRR